jgi:hypothetical protein
VSCANSMLFRRHRASVQAPREIVGHFRLARIYDAKERSINADMASVGKSTANYSILLAAVHSGSLATMDKGRTNIGPAFAIAGAGFEPATFGL